jgi:hypothetical protein
MSLVTGGLFLGLVASGCRERNPAYIPDGYASEDVALPADTSVDSGTPDTKTVPRDTNTRSDTRVDARDAAVDSQPEVFDGADSPGVPPADVFDDAGEEGDLPGDDGPPTTRDVLSDTEAFVDSLYDASSSRDGTDGPGGNGRDTGIPILDGQPPDARPDGPGFSIDAPEGTDGPKKDASNDGGVAFDGQVVDTNF